MDLQKLTIGQMAELNHISEQTLRLYDREGLLKPQYTDENTGYRYYHITQSARLDMIQNMKVYGMTLRRIREFLEENDADALQRLLLEQAGQVDARIEQLSRSRAAIMRTLDNFKRYEAMPKNGEIFIEFIPERHIYRYSCDMNYFDQDETGYEYMLRQLKRHLLSNNMPLSYFSNVGTVVRKEHLLSGNIFSNEVFLFVDERDKTRDAERVPAATYVCLCSSEFSRERENIDFPVLDFDKRQMIYKTQIPVCFPKK